MALFTRQERMVLQFLAATLVVGLFIAGYRQIFPSASPVAAVDQEAFTRLSLLTGEGPARGVKVIINLNTAGKAELMRLPSIGAVMAERIIRHREDFGPFTALEDLTRINGIGTKTIQRIQTLVTW